MSNNGVFKKNPTKNHDIFSFDVNWVFKSHYNLLN